jgi:hypothetical protein
VHQDGPAIRPDANWRDAHEFLRSDCTGADIVSQLEALGADPVKVARYLVLWLAIWARTIHEAGGIPGT